MSETLTDKAVDGRESFGTPLLVRGHNRVLVPVARESKAGWFSDTDYFREGGQSLASGGSSDTESLRVATATVRWHNGIFASLGGGESWPLLERRGVISRYWMLWDPRPDVFGSRGLYFAATVTDTNGDGKLHDLDATRLLATNPDGSEPRFVTPKGSRLTGVSRSHRDDLLYVSLVLDEDESGTFDESEIPRPYLLEIGSRGVAKPLLDPIAIQAVTDLLD